MAFCVADGADDGDHAEHEREGAKEALMIVINRKRGARLASVCVCVWLMFIYIIPLPLDKI